MGFRTMAVVLHHGCANQPWWDWGKQLTIHRGMQRRTSGNRHVDWDRFSRQVKKHCPHGTLCVLVFFFYKACTSWGKANVTKGCVLSWCELKECDACVPSQLFTLLLRPTISPGTNYCLLLDLTEKYVGYEPQLKPCFAHLLGNHWHKKWIKKKTAPLLSFFFFFT